MPLPLNLILFTCLRERKTDMTIVEKIRTGKTYLGIELGSTRIKACLIDDEMKPIASGAHEWKNRFENGYWTYFLDDIHNGIRSCYASLLADVKEKYGVCPETYGAMGVSAMMHGIMAFDENGTLLTPFRTWRNTTSEKAAAELTELLDFNIPQRWSCAHFYQSVLDKEEYVPRTKKVTTLAGYIHFMLSGENAVGIGEASGIFPVDMTGYDKNKLKKYADKIASHGYDNDIYSLFPAVKSAGEKGAYLTEEGARFLDPTGSLKAGVPLCPPEGDAGTGMVATNSVRAGTGNISAGTSVFSMLVLSEPLAAVHREIDMVTTPDGYPVAMVHCNSCCTELDAWVNMFGEFGALMGCDIDKSELYEKLYRNAMNAAPDCGGAVAYGFMSGEPAANVEKGYPAYFRSPEHAPTLGEFFRAQLYSSVGALKMGMDILFDTEKVSAQLFTCHGGLFKVKNAAAQIIADALDTPAAVMTTAGEGGAWGIALLAAYMMTGNGKKLADWLDSTVFGDMEKTVSYPEEKGREGYEKYIAAFRKGLAMYGKE